MNSSSSSSSSSTSVRETRLLSSSSSPPPPPPPPPPRSLQSPELQAEFLQEFQNKFRSHGGVGESGLVAPVTSDPSPLTSSSPVTPSSPVPSPFSPASSPWSSSSSSSSPGHDGGRGPARLSLSSPELLSELKDSRTRPLRRVTASKGLTIVFSGRGRGAQASGPAPSTRAANQRTSR